MIWAFLYLSYLASNTFSAKVLLQDDLAFVNDDASPAFVAELLEQLHHSMDWVAVKLMPHAQFISNPDASSHSFGRIHASLMEALTHDISNPLVATFLPKVRKAVILMAKKDSLTDHSLKSTHVQNLWKQHSFEFLQQWQQSRSVVSRKRDGITGLLLNYLVIFLSGPLVMQLIYAALPDLYVDQSQQAAFQKESSKLMARAHHHQKLGMVRN